MPHPAPTKILFNAGGLDLSAQELKPEGRAPRATIIALHGGGYTGAYWHHAALPDASLLTLGGNLGYRVIALDRPGYGASAAHCYGMVLDDQAQMMHGLITALARNGDIGAGICLIGHSMGGILALMTAARLSGTLLVALDVSGVPRHFSDILTRSVDATVEGSPPKAQVGSAATLFYGPPVSFPASLISNDPAAAPCPLPELSDSRSWPDRFPDIAARIAVPVQYTLGEHETVTACDWKALKGTAALFSAAPRVVVHRQVDAGHNISLHHVGRAYHLRALAFFDEALSAASATR